jgi:hypothetical protein
MSEQVDDSKLRRLLRQISKDTTKTYNDVISYNVEYNRQRRNLLDTLCEQYGSDKGYVVYDCEKPYSWYPHNYTDFYIDLFGHCRQYIKAVFECGIGTNNTEYNSNMTKTGKPGASLRVWRDFFYNAQIVGADIDPGSLFSEDRIHTVCMDQTNSIEVYNVFSRLPHRYDIIIDDGLHEFTAGYNMFNIAKDYLTDNGVYIIEDVKQHDLQTYKTVFRHSDYIVRYVKLLRDYESVNDNNIIVIKKS